MSLSIHRLLLSWIYAFFSGIYVFRKVEGRRRANLEKDGGKNKKKKKSNKSKNQSWSPIEVWGICGFGCPGLYQYIAVAQTSQNIHNVLNLETASSLLLPITIIIIIIISIEPRATEPTNSPQDRNGSSLSKLTPPGVLRKVLRDEVVDPTPTVCTSIDKDTMDMVPTDKAQENSDETSGTQEKPFVLNEKNDKPQVC